MVNGCCQLVAVNHLIPIQFGSSYSASAWDLRDNSPQSVSHSNWRVCRDGILSNAAGWSFQARYLFRSQLPNTWTFQCFSHGQLNHQPKVVLRSWVRVCQKLKKQVHIFQCTYTYIYIYIYTFIHIYIYIHMIYPYISPNDGHFTRGMMIAQVIPK